MQQLKGPERAIPLTAVVLSILLSLADGEKHGYAIMKEVSLTEGGSLSMGPGTLYGSLDRMVNSGLVAETESTDNDRRRYYRITEFGSKVLQAELARLRHIMNAARRKGVGEAVRP